MFPDNKKDPVGMILSIIVYRKLVIIISFMSVFCVTLVGVKFMPAVYESYAKILINPPTLPRKLDMPYLEEIAGRTFLGNQKEILRSRMVYERVARRLRLAEIIPPQSFVRKGIIFIKNLLIKNDQVIDKNEIAINNIRMNSSVEFIRGTNIAMIMAKSTNPEGAALLANTIADVYTKYANSMISNTATEAYRYLEKRVNETANELKIAEDELNRYTEKNSTLMIEGEKEFIVKSLTDLEEKLQQANLQLSEVDRLIRSGKISDKTKTSNGSFGITTTNLEHQNYIKSLDEQLVELERSLSNALITLTEDHPDVKLLRSKIRRIKEKIKKSYNTDYQSGESAGNEKIDIREQTMKLENTRQEIINRKNFLMKQKQSLLSKKSNITEKYMEYEKLKNKCLVLKTKLDMLNSKIEDANVLQASDTQSGTIRIIEPAHPPIYPASTKSKILLVLGTFTGIIFSLGMAFIAEYFDDRLKDIADAEKFFNLPVLGTVPKLSEKEKNELLTA